MIQAAGVSAAGIAIAAIMACVDKNRIAICTFLGIVTAMLMVRRFPYSTMQGALPLAAKSPPCDAMLPYVS